MRTIVNYLFWCKIVSEFFSFFLFLSLFLSFFFVFEKDSFYLKFYFINSTRGPTLKATLTKIGSRAIGCASLLYNIEISNTGLKFRHLVSQWFTFSCYCFFCPLIIWLYLLLIKILLFMFSGKKIQRLCFLPLLFLVTRISHTSQSYECINNTSGWANYWSYRR